MSERPPLLTVFTSRSLCRPSYSERRPRLGSFSTAMTQCEPRQTTPMRCLISRWWFSETTSTRRRRSTGGAISQMTLNLDGRHGRAGFMQIPISNS
jgi:hypothetical protein